VIAAVRGTLQGKTLDSALITIGAGSGSVTLRVYAPLSVLANLQVGAEVALHTHFLVREDALSLYGFLTGDDRDLFEQLLAVGGVGPRIGLALLSSMSAHAFREAVVNEDVQRLTLAPGVGKKLASRLVLELRPRFEKMGIVGVAAGIPAGAPGGMRTQVLEALTGLGYTPAEAAAAVRSLPDDASGALEDLIFRALRSLAKE
jgi:Holliday junction DNA helicase RuvA